MDVGIEEVNILVSLIKFLTPRQRNHFLKTMNKSQMRVLEIACFNLATNPKGLNDSQLKTLSKYKRHIETVASKNYKLGEKRRVVTQKGGFVGALLPILGTLVTSFLTSR